MVRIFELVLPHALCSDHLEEVFFRSVNARHHHIWHSSNNRVSHFFNRFIRRETIEDELSITQSIWISRDPLNTNHSRFGTIDDDAHFWDFYFWIFTCTKCWINSALMTNIDNFNSYDLSFTNRSMPILSLNWCVYWGYWRCNTNGMKRKHRNDRHDCAWHFFLSLISNWIDNNYEWYLIFIAQQSALIRIAKHNYVHF